MLTQVRQAWAQSAQAGDGTDLAFGLGANWKINKSIGLRAEWERFQNLSVDGGTERDVDLLSLGASYRF